MQTHSLLTLLENEKLTKEFYRLAHKNCYQIIISGKYDFTKPLSWVDANNLLKEVGIETDLMQSVHLNDTVDDDVFGFACQQYLVDLSEDPDKNQEEMFQVKKFLTYHTIYAEAMKDSPYDKVLRQLAGQDPIDDPMNVNGTTISSEPVKTIFDDIDAKYIDCKFTFKPGKSYQKPKFYKGCKFLKVNDDIKNQYTAESFSDTTITDDQGIEHNINDCYPVFATEHPEIGDIAISQSPRKQIVLGTKDIIDTIKNSNFQFSYYTTKFNNRKVETLKVKRFACGTLDKDLSSVPYHVNIVYEEVPVNHNIDAIAKHYNVTHDKLIRKEVDILKKVELALDHPLNIARAEWVLLHGPSGSGKTTVAIEYANNKGISYVVQQGHAHLSQDDFLGYTSIVKNDKDQSTEDLYVRSLLREAVEFGKIFIIDEIDGCSPNALLALNSLKNKQFQFPDKLVDIHPNFRLIATANTLEYSDVYNGRSKLDKATLARFKHIEYNLENHHLAIRYGLEHIKDIKNIDRLEPREIERLVTEAIIEKEMNDN